ncbi:hypothetical protein KSP39_PZI011290 [Platanthera zijinensis]|uniref:Uncharacterized protein n=1 Tax=Platanthera zijinensis TaxID=2320716 RepID=A0AAP0BIM3_9ASPA
MRPGYSLPLLPLKLTLSRFAVSNELPEKPLPLAKEAAATQSDSRPPADVGEKKAVKGKSRVNSQGPARKRAKTSSPRSVDCRSPTGAQSPHFHPNYGLGQGVVDAFGRPLVTWSAGENSVSLSTNLPSWSTDWEDNGEAFAVLHAIYGRADAESVMELTPTELAHQSACALARSAELGHYSARKLLETTDALKVVSKKAIDLGMQSVRWRDFEILTSIISQAAEIEAAKKLSECEEKLAASQAELEAAQTRAAVMETRLVAAEGRLSSSTPLPEDPARVPPGRPPFLQPCRRRGRPRPAETPAPFVKSRWWHCDAEFAFLFQQPKVRDFIRAVLYDPKHGYFSKTAGPVGVLEKSIRFNQLKETSSSPSSTLPLLCAELPVPALPCSRADAALPPIGLGRRLCCAERAAAAIFLLLLLSVSSSSGRLLLCSSSSTTGGTPDVRRRFAPEELEKV